MEPNEAPEDLMIGSSEPPEPEAREHDPIVGSYLVRIHLRGPAGVATPTVEKLVSWIGNAVAWGGEVTVSAERIDR